jgi:hypothetical protein
MDIRETYPKKYWTEGMRVIDATDEAVHQFGTAYGSELLVVSKEDIDALLAGRAWAFPVNGGEYVHFVALAKEVKP